MAEPTSSTRTLEIQVTCPPVLAGYLQELLWTVDGVESVGELYRSHGESDEVQPSDLAYISVLTRNPLGEDLIKVLMVDNPRLMKVCDIVGTRWIEEADWAESWKQYWHPTRITEHLTVVPSWEAYQPRPDERVIVLDPGCAFGTGTHETTRLMLQMLEELADRHDFSQWSFLDVGTGSGILAIEAALQGSRTVRGIDTDPLAIPAAQENAERNGVGHVIEFSDTPIEELCLTPYDVVMANIIAPVILSLWPEMLQRLASGGVFLASGLIERSVGDVEAVMRKAGLTDIQRRQEGDWFALSGIRG